jgi:hypothetical protein
MFHWGYPAIRENTLNLRMEKDGGMAICDRSWLRPFSTTVLPPNLIGAK